MEEPLLVLGLGGNVARLVRRVALVGDLDERVASGLVERREDAKLARLAEPQRKGADVSERGAGTADRQLGGVSLLAVQELGEQPQARLVEQRVDVLEMDPQSRDQRRLQLAV